MSYFLAYKGLKGAYNLAIQEKELQAIIKQCLGRKRNQKLGAIILKFCAYTQDMSPQEYTIEYMDWELPRDALRWLDGHK